MFLTSISDFVLGLAEHNDGENLVSIPVCTIFEILTLHKLLCFIYVVL